MIVEMEKIKTIINELENQGFCEEANSIRDLVENLEAAYINNFLSKTLKKSLTEDFS